MPRAVCRRQARQSLAGIRLASCGSPSGLSAVRFVSLVGMIPVSPRLAFSSGGQKWRFRDLRPWERENLAPGCARIKERKAASTITCPVLLGFAPLWALAYQLSAPALDCRALP